MEVKWIKITTAMFEDEKIDFIESLPEADAIIIIWIKLLTLAGKCNANGFIYLTETIPYTEEMLSHKFRRPLNVVKLALATFENLQMIEFDNGYLKIVNWKKHQNIEGLEKIREQTRKRVTEYRERQKALPNSNVTGNVTVTGSNETDIDIEEDIDKERDIRVVEVVEDQLSKKEKELIISRWNELGLQQLRSISNNRASSLKARINEYSLDEVVQAIKKVKNSSFLRGQNKNNWVITFDWLIKPNNFVKVLEGNYDDKEAGDGNSRADDKKGKWDIDHLINR